ncbi:L10-interacting MYB domain-containing protein-like [Olea europaea var. sylvestris]|uniref:L10-interacting MYB domain-containing protein-like n=1 Tax=Olea europaea var. sylvestris TaxID=158386 RepID=UPI000C1CD76B|nr:L10-interacting MYB domain-containing protein-like [Olea europaea var. sylvestris]
MNNHGPSHVPGTQPNFGSHPHPNSSTSYGHHVDSESGPRKHAQLTDYETQIFVAACETVIADEHRNGKCFTKFGWQTLVHLFNTNSGHNWSKQQLKNRWDALRLKHKRFKELINSSGGAYDTSTGLINASAEWWDRKTKERKEYKDKDCRELYRYKNAMIVDSADGNESGPRKHAQWIDYETQIFVAACETVIADGHQNGKCFTKFEWRTLVHLFNTNSGHNWSKQQLKNRWDALRLKHKRFEELINSSGVAYDTSTSLISASVEWWDRKTKVPSYTHQ